MTFVSAISVLLSTIQTLLNKDTEVINRGFDRECKEVLSCHTIISQLFPIFELNEMIVRMSQKKGPHESYPLGCYQAFDFKVKILILSPIVESYQQSHALTRQQLLQIVCGKYQEKFTKASFMHFLINTLIEFMFSVPCFTRTYNW
jgi:hypothetical protein